MNNGINIMVLKGSCKFNYLPINYICRLFYITACINIVKLIMVLNIKIKVLF